MVTVVVVIVDVVVKVIVVVVVVDVVVVVVLVMLVVEVVAVVIFKMVVVVVVVVVVVLVFVGVVSVVAIGTDIFAGAVSFKSTTLQLTRNDNGTTPWTLTHCDLESSGTVK